MDVGTLVARSMQKYRDRIAVESSEGSLTYGEIGSRIFHIPRKPRTQDGAGCKIFWEVREADRNPGQRRPPERLLLPSAVYPGASKLPLELYIGRDQRDKGFGRIGDCSQPYYRHERC